MEPPAAAAEPIAEKTVTEPATPKLPGAPADEPRKMRVLAAEDNKTNQLVFRKMVKQLDFDLTFANNGEEAVEAYKQIQPDLIFMDISMPRMDGREATQAIRALEAETGGHVPIVALTAHALDGDDQGILAAGLDHYLTKPLRKPKIFDMVKTYCPEEAASPFPEELAAAG